jgi:CDP-diacylglycerol---glycerol-3-phosphate 3-phosphatidyltransferase
MSINDTRHRLGARASAPLVALLVRLRVTPNALTWCGLLLGIGTAALIGLGYFIAGGLMVLFSGAFDMLDGALARATNRTTVYGGVLDSVIDRLSEAALMLGVLVFYVNTPATAAVFNILAKDWSLVVTAAAIAAAAWPSYVRARAEAAGIDASAGFFTRPERVVLIAIGLFTGQPALALAVLVVLSVVTTGQRLYRAGQAGNSKKPD